MSTCGGVAEWSALDSSGMGESPSLYCAVSVGSSNPAETALRGARPRFGSFICVQCSCARCWWIAALPCAPATASGGSQFRTRRFHPLLGPLQADLFGEGAGAGVVQADLADALGAELGKDRVEFLAAETEGLDVGAVAQGDHAVVHAFQGGARHLQR